MVGGKPAVLHPPVLGRLPMLHLALQSHTPQSRSQCGRSGHFLASCILWPKEGDSTVTAGILVSQSSLPLYPQTPLQLDATLMASHQPLPLLGLVDSEADVNFLDSDFVSQADIAMEPLSTPLDDNTLDGRLLANITHCTKPRHLLEKIQFHVTPRPPWSWASLGYIDISHCLHGWHSHAVHCVPSSPGKGTVTNENTCLTYYCQMYRNKMKWTMQLSGKV